MKKNIVTSILGMVLMVALLSTIVFFPIAVGAVDGVLKVHMLKIKEGRSDCLVVELPNGQNMVIDIPKFGSEPLQQKLEELGINSLDYLVGTHNHPDHIAGIDEFLDSGFVINNSEMFYPKGKINTAKKPAFYSEMRAAAQRRDLSIKMLVRHDAILDTTYDDKPLKITAVSPRADKADGGRDDYKAQNVGSLALKVTYGDSGILFMGDAAKPTEMHILEDSDTSDLWAQVLKAGHHGAPSGKNPATTDEFLDALDIQYALITNSKPDFNKPTRDRLKSRNIKYWVGGVTGDCWFSTVGDGEWTPSEDPVWPAIDFVD